MTFSLDYQHGHGNNIYIQLEVSALTWKLTIWVEVCLPSEITGQDRSVSWLGRLPESRLTRKPGDRLYLLQLIITPLYQPKLNCIKQNLLIVFKLKTNFDHPEVWDPPARLKANNKYSFRVKPESKTQHCLKLY